MPSLAQRAGTKNQLFNYNFGQKTCEEPAPGVLIHISKMCFGDWVPSLKISFYLKRLSIEGYQTWLL